jgi:Tat protein secretion system quality control protein TatD with DNase activity
VIIAVGENLSDAHKNLEPANISLSIKAIAELKDVAEEEVIAAVSENTERLYGEL